MWFVTVQLTSGRMVHVGHFADQGEAQVFCRHAIRHSKVSNAYSTKMIDVVEFDRL